MQGSTTGKCIHPSQQWCRSLWIHYDSPDWQGPTTGWSLLGRSQQLRQALTLSFCPTWRARIWDLTRNLWPWISFANATTFPAFIVVTAPTIGWRFQSRSRWWPVCRIRKKPKYRFLQTQDRPKRLSIQHLYGPRFLGMSACVPKYSFVPIDSIPYDKPCAISLSSSQNCK